MKKNYNAIDITKYFCAILVLIIHMAPFTTISPLLNNAIGSILCRIAVPFFFMVSSFFFFKKKGNILQNFKRFAIRILGLYLIYTVIYFSYYLIKGESFSFFETIQKILFEAITVHLWYFVADVVAVGMVLLLTRFMSDKITLIICLALYLVGTVCSTYYSLLPHNNLFGGLVSAYLSIFLTFRNGVFFGSLFVLIGKMVANKERIIEKRKLSFWIVSFFISLALMGAEGVIISKYTVKTDIRDFLIVLPLCALCFFCLVLGIEPYFARIKKSFSVITRNVSTLFYALHFLFIYLVPIDNIMIKFLAIIILNTLVSLGVVLLSRKIKILRFLY